MTELVDVVDSRGRTTDTVPRSVVRARNLRHRCVFVLLLNSKGELLVTKRTASKDVSPSLLEIARGGTCAAGESFEECAKRELEEEAGVRAGEGDAKLEFIFDFDYKDEFVNEHCRVFSVVYDGPLSLQKEEVESGFFVSQAKLSRMMKSNPKDFCADNLPLMNSLSKSGFKSSARFARSSP